MIRTRESQPPARGNAAASGTTGAEEGQLRALVANALDVICLLDADGMVRYVSPSVTRVLGWLPEALVGRSLLDFVHPEEQATARLTLADGANRPGSAWSLQLRLRHRNQSWRLWDLTAKSLLHDEAVRGVVVNCRDTTDRQDVESALLESESQLRAIFEGAGTGIALIDLQGRPIKWNPEFQRMLSYGADELPSLTVFDFTHPAYIDQNVRLFNELISGRRASYEIEKRYLRRDGSEVWVRVSASLVRGAQGEPQYVVGLIHDVTDAKQAEAALRGTEARYRTLFENSRDAIYSTSRDGGFVQVNQAAVEMFGYSRDELLALKATALYVDTEDRDRFQAEVEARGSVRDFEVRLRRKDGSELFCLLTSHLRRDAAGELEGYDGIIHDFTNRKLAEEQLRHAALHDGLTGLPNRAFFMDKLVRSLDRAKRRPDFRFAVLFVDLDRFKVINDSLGHSYGDKLLSAIAERLENSIRPGDTVARLGGDEFAILLFHLQTPDDAVVVAERIQAALRAPFVMDEHELYTTASVGIALSTTGYDNAEVLLRNADTAMYAAKAKGKEQYVLFDEAMYQEALAQLELETALRHAVEREEFLLHYQPIVSLDDGRIIGFEALLRWQHPQRGLIAPMDFIPVAEETGMIVPIGQWVLRDACATLAGWRAQDPAFAELLVSVNISSKQLVIANLSQQIRRILEETGLPGSCLKLEITEGVMLKNASSVQRTLQELKAMGIRLAVDDFGTGYSSLSYLQDFPIDLLKIDRSFVARLGGLARGEGGTDANDAEIVRTIVALARNLGLEVVAEGVETAGQISELVQAGCGHAQGYYFSRPMTRADAEALMRRRASGVAGEWAAVEVPAG